MAVIPPKSNNQFHFLGSKPTYHSIKPNDILDFAVQQYVYVLDDLVQSVVLAQTSSYRLSAFFVLTCEATKSLRASILQIPEHLLTSIPAQSANRNKKSPTLPNRGNTVLFLEKFDHLKQQWQPTDISEKFLRKILMNLFSLNLWGDE